MDSLPSTAMLMTASLNSIVTDSAPGAACYSTGNKSNNNQEGVFPDDTTDKWDNPRVEHMGAYLARTQGKALGIVTTADVEDATPAAFAVHTQDRGAGTGICDMFLDEGVAFANLRVLMGGGRKWFLPTGQPGSGRVNSATSSGADYVLPAEIATAWGVPAGSVNGARDLIADFQTAGFTYAPDATTLGAIPANTDRLLGLFNTGNMDVSFDKINARRGGPATGTIATFPDQPMLDDMTRKALQVLNRNSQGFVLMVEGASIDKQAHNMDTERFILDTVEFDRSVGAALEFVASNPDTLLIVTADHECAGINVIGGSRVTNAALQTAASGGGGAAALRDSVVGTYDLAGFPDYVIQSDGYPATMNIDYKMLIGYAGNADRYEDWLANPVANAAPTGRDTAGNFLVTGQVPGSSAVHTGSDIQLSAAGRGSVLFGGVMDNTEPFFKAMQAVIGGSK
jgi:alkaline phosphatase